MIDIMIDMIVKKTYIDGDVDKFINTVIKPSASDVTELLKLTEEENKNKKYLIQIADYVKAMTYIGRVLQTKKIEKNRADFIKLGKELLNIAEGLINLGKEDI